MTVSVPALMTFAPAANPPVESNNEAPAEMFTGVLVEVPVRVSTPPVMDSEPPPTVPETSTAPVLVVLPKRLPDTVPPLSVAPPVAVNAALPARVLVPFWM